MFWVFFLKKEKEKEKPSNGLQKGYKNNWKNVVRGIIVLLQKFLIN
jgi:hypothetical protein